MADTHVDKRTEGQFSASKPVVNSDEWIQQEVAKIRAERKAKAAPGSAESRGSWTDKSGLQ